MIQVLAEYVNIKSKSGNDYFIFTNVEVMGHAEKTGYDTNIKVCAGVSACCYGINRLVDEGTYNYETRKGYFHCWTDRQKNLKQVLDKGTVYALNTLVCQLYEIYRLYPRAFKSFELVDIKEKIENDGKREKRIKKSRNRMGLYFLIEEPYHQEN